MKKEKIKKILKYVGISLFLLCMIIFCIGTCSKNTNALEPIDNFNIYTNIGQIQGISNSGTIYTFGLTNDTSYYKYDNSNFVYNVEYQYYTYYFDSDDLVNEVDPVLKIDISELKVGAIILWGGFVDDVNQSIYIDRLTTINRYLDKLTDVIFSAAYESGSDTSDPLSPYNIGKQKGFEEGSLDKQDALNAQKAQYEAALAAKDLEIQHLEDVINSGQTAWGSFTSLLGSIFLFPIHFFKEGFNVQLFGINIGALVVGLGILGIAFAIIGIILGRRSK